MKECKHPGCAQKDDVGGSGGFCGLHYTRSRYGQNMDMPYRNAGANHHKRKYDVVCSWSGCNGRHDSNGLCSMHAQRKRGNSKVDMNAPKRSGCKIRPLEYIGQHGCKYKTCEADYHADGLCQRHYNRRYLLLNGDTIRAKARTYYALNRDYFNTKQRARNTRQRAAADKLKAELNAINTAADLTALARKHTTSSVVIKRLIAAFALARKWTCTRGKYAGPNK